MSLLEQTRPMTIDAFLAFTDTRPDGERWELIDGEPVMNPSPSFNHQTIVANIIYELGALQRQRRAAWTVVPGIGVKLSQHNMPIPDVLLRPRQRLSGYFCDDMIVAFEVLSPSSRSMDLRWKRNAYTKLPSLQHYVVVHQDEIVLRCFDRADGWAERRFRAGDGALELAAVGVTLDLNAVYADTGL